MTGPPPACACPAARPGPFLLEKERVARWDTQAAELERDILRCAVQGLMAREVAMGHGGDRVGKASGDKGPKGRGMGAQDSSDGQMARRSPTRWAWWLRA